MNAFFAEIRHTVIPERDSPHGPLAPLLLVLTVVTGLVDSFSYLELGHVFVANMTGNVVFLAFALVGARGFSIPASIAALCAFGVGAGIGGRVSSKLAPDRARLLSACAMIQTLFVAASVVLAALSANSVTAGFRYGLIVVLGLSMGIQNAAARKLAVPDLTTTVLTMTITGITADGPLAGRTGARTGPRGLTVVTMFAGAVVGALFIVHSQKVVPLAIALITVAVVSATTRALGAAHPTWPTSMPDDDVGHSRVQPGWPVSVRGRWYRPVGAGPGDLEEPGLLGDHLDGVPQPERGLADRRRGHNRALEPVGRFGPHDDGRRLGLGPTEGVGDLHGLHDGCVPLVVVSGVEQIGVQATRRYALAQDGVVAQGTIDEEATTPLGVERIDGPFTHLGPGGLEDPKHSVRGGMPGEGHLAQMLGDGGGHAVVVADLEAVRPPQDPEVTLRCDLFDPQRRDPCPWATGIHEHFHVGHSTRLYGLLRSRPWRTGVRYRCPRAALSGAGTGAGVTGGRGERDRKEDER